MPIDYTKTVAEILSDFDERIVAVEDGVGTDLYTPERLIRPEIMYPNAEWVTTNKHRYACPPLVNPIEFGSTKDPTRPGTGLYPQLSPGEYTHPNDRDDLFVNPQAFPGGICSGPFNGLGGRRVYCRHLRVDNGTFRWQLISEWVQIEGFDSTRFTDQTDALYVGGASLESGYKPVAIFQGNRTGPTIGSDRAPTVTAVPVQQGGTLNVSAVTAATMLTSTRAQFTLNAAPADGMPVAGKEIIVENVSYNGQIRISRDFNQSWLVVSVSGMVIVADKTNTGGDLPPSGANGVVTTPASTDTGKSRVFIMGGSQENEDYLGEHADSLGQTNNNLVFSAVKIHNCVASGSYQPGGIWGTSENNQTATTFSNVYIKHVNLGSPVQRSCLAIKFGRISDHTYYPTELIECYLDSTERPWVTTVSALVSPNVSESQYSISYFGAQEYTDPDGFKVLSYDPMGAARGGFILNKAPPRDFAPVANVGPTGVHPGVGNLPAPLITHLTGLNLSPSSVSSAAALGDVLATLKLTGNLPGNTIVDITITNSASQFVGLEGRTLKRTGLPLPVGNLSIEFTCKVYPIDATTHARGALAFTKVVTKNLTVTSSGAATTIVAVSQPTPAAKAGVSSAPYMYSFDNQAIGTANTVREILIPFVLFTNSTRTINSVTVNGKTATLVAGSASNNNYTSNYTYTGMYRVALGVDDPGTASIVFNLSGSAAGCYIGVEAVTGIGVIYDIKTFTAAREVVEPASFTAYYGTGCLAIGWAGYSSIAASSGGNRRAFHAKQLLDTATPPGSLLVDPVFVSPNLDLASGFTEIADVQVTSAGTPMTAGGVIVFGPST